MTHSRIPSALLATMFGLVAGAAQGHAQADGAAIDTAVIAEVAAKYKIPSEVVSHIELTAAFDTRTPWTLVITKQPDNDKPPREDLTDGEGAVTVCFVKQSKPDCSDDTFLKRYAQQPIQLSFNGERPFYSVGFSEIVHARPDSQDPLLLVKARTLRYGNGDYWVSTLLYAYDRQSDSFRTVFYGLTARNRNESTRFIESGPLLGRVIVVTPTADAPYGYFVEVYRHSPGGDYRRVLKYRSRTRYGDGNSLPVIDAEMPEILRRFGLWKPGQELPVPDIRPKGCSQLVLHKGAMWCASELAAASAAARR